MFHVLPKWYLKAEKDLGECIDKIIRSNKIDWHFSHDSKVIENSKSEILMTLVYIYENIGIEERERLKKFEKEIKKDLKKEKGKKNENITNM